MGARGAYEKLAAGMMLTAVHGLFSRKVLGLKPDALLGLSSGEKDILFAGGICPLSAIMTHFERVREKGLMSTELAGDYRAVRRAWGLAEQGPVHWALWRVAAPVEQVQQALAGENRVHLAILHTPRDVVIAGDRDSCLRVLDRLGRPTAFEATDYRLAFHVPEVLAVRSPFLHCFTFPVHCSPNVRFYSSARGEARPLTPEGFAEDYLAQASGTVEFPRLIRKAWDDGVRLFVEHGPHSLCSRLINEILGNRPHLSVALDAQNTPALTAAALAAAELLAAGVQLDWRALNARLELCRAGAAGPEPASSGHPLYYPAHFPPLVLPARPLVWEDRIGPQDEIEEPAPAPVLVAAPDAPFEVEAALHEDAGQDLPALVLDAIRQQRRVFSHHLQGLSANQQRLLGLHALIMRGLTHPRGAPALPPGPEDISLPELQGDSQESPAVSPPQPERAPVPAREPGQPLKPCGPSFNREQLEVLASGKISAVFGPLFARQDGYRRQVRLPTPPLLLVDRITGLDAEPGVHGTGTIWTETDVSWDSWYLHQGVMPAGILIESGQADLTLISWMGTDFLNQGERVYRLLGCDLTYHGGLPRPGDTLCYDIHIDGHARQGEIRLFFFHYDCRINGRLRMTVRNGQAGFFTDRELAESGGILWSPETGDHSTDARVDSPAALAARTSFSKEQLTAYYEGRPAECFGPGYELLHTHTRTPLGGKPSMRLSR